MSKKVLMMGLAAVCGLTMLHTATAEAGTWVYRRPPGTWWWVQGLGVCAKITRVPDPGKKPAVMICSVEIFDGVCLNPTDKSVTPGEAAEKFLVSAPIDEGTLSEKEKGVANVCAAIEPRCKLRNWTLRVTEFEAQCSNYACVGTDDPETPDVNEACNTIESDNPADTQTCSCMLPAGVDPADAVSCKDPLNPDEDCTRYECFDVVTGNACQLE